MEAPARPQQVVHHVGPRRQVGQPVECTEARVDHVERPAAEGSRRVVDVGLDEVGLDADALRDAASRGHRLAGEVEARDPGATTGPRQRVQAEVALQVDQVQPIDRTDRLDLDGPQRVVRAGDEALGVVEAAADVVGDPLVPEAAVQLELGTHLSILPDRPTGRGRETGRAARHGPVVGRAVP